MADKIPAALRQADINLWKCATKAGQLQLVKPIITYWCEYWVVNQILAKQLHNSDDEIMQYTINLMDKLEQTKAEYGNEAAILDDAAGQAYVEQFAQETLDRAERVVKANKVTQQTATTFDAAATFFHLVNIWGTPDQETQQKIKYAKWNAARIAKAIKDGKDPNESNPKHEEPQQPALDLSDPEVQMLGRSSPAVAPRPATVEEVPDVDLRRDAAGVSLPHSPVSAGPSPPSDGELRLPGVPTELGPPASHAGYFDTESMPSPISPPIHDSHGYQSAPDLPPPAGWAPRQPSPDIPPPPRAAWSQAPGAPPPQTGWTPNPVTYQPPAPPTAPPTFAMSPPSTAAVASPPVNPPTDPYYMNMTPTAHTSRPVAPPVAQPARYAPVQPAATVTIDEAAMVGAQKHAKWAISALNFEDVSTAVKELRKALEMLGAA
ncbi:Vta1 like-domain-containing protein [Lasiosphaeria miniovina]|uniref:Vta1 like-domain-containing protein n=1 Tax=Lasiosphaeria miniovina TaxID=1954250 RepID=A0AA40BI48_9PEZI|nr:Vta1 like-domain-containing protein [Lasiosphaeria miniovina]KAK0734652.1 Vta1 like-domain-containing protein [Lasiosphaeria miniovina]